jgi:hypothetical protein
MQWAEDCSAYFPELVSIRQNHKTAMFLSKNYQQRQQVRKFGELPALWQATCILDSNLHYAGGKSFASA